MHNPYRWDSDLLEQEVELGRQEPRSSVLGSLYRGSGVVLLGGRGMGKSVFLRQLERELKADSSVAVFLQEAPPVERTVAGALATLARQLGIAGNAVPVPPTARELISRYLEEHPDVKTVVLLFDELDQYAIEGSAATSSFGRMWFDHLEAARKSLRNLGLLAAGGLGIYLLRHTLSSNFLSRARWVKLLPFDDTEIEMLANSFKTHRQRLDPMTLDAIRLASGGNPALTVYALESLWESQTQTTDDVLDLYTNFQREHHEFIRSALKALTAEAFSDGPMRVLELIRRGDGSLLREDMKKELGTDSKLDLQDACDLLQAAGLIHLDGSWLDERVQVHAVASIFNLALESSYQGDSTTGLLLDLKQLLGSMHAMGVDLLTSSRTMLPEAVYSAFLALGLRLKGWEAEREAQHGAGRTDLKVWRPGTTRRAVVEVKIWGRNDYAGIQSQVCSYWSEQVHLGVALMLTEAPPSPSHENSSPGKLSRLPAPVPLTA